MSPSGSAKAKVDMFYVAVVEIVNLILIVIEKFYNNTSRILVG